MLEGPLLVPWVPAPAQDRRVSCDPPVGPDGRLCTSVGNDPHSPGAHTLPTFGGCYRNNPGAQPYEAGPFYLSL